MSFENSVFVKLKVEEPLVSIKFNYSIAPNKQRLFTFNRDKNEPVKNCFKRMQQNIFKEFKKDSLKNKEKFLENQKCFIFKLFNGDQEIDTSLNHMDAWQMSKCFKVDEQSFEVVINGPSVLNLKLPKVLLSNFIIYPELELDFADFDQSEYYWYRQKLNKKTNNHSKLSLYKKLNNKEQSCQTDSKNWELIFKSFYYVPTNEDISRQLKFKCIPANCGRRGFEVEEVSKNVVEASPGLLPCEERHKFTQNFTKNGEIRVVCYNILADTYADSDKARNILFEYCPDFALKFDYRKNLIIKEILGYNADIICLQEVDRKFFKKDLSLILEKLKEMEGFYSEKFGNVKEGVASFFRKTKFICLETRTESFTQLLFQNSLFQTYLQIVFKNPCLIESLKERNTVVQFMLLKDVNISNKALLVANTHLYFHPKAAHIRLFHASMMIVFIQFLLETYKNKYRDLKISLLICGDFNSVPQSGIYQLMTTGSVDQNLEDWKSDPNEIIEKLNVMHSFSLASACNTPEYTNYCAGFKGCLDYIFYDVKNLKVNEVVPFPSHESVTLHQALPSVIFPSDHIALVSVLNWI